MLWYSLVVVWEEKHHVGGKRRKQEQIWRNVGHSWGGQSCLFLLQRYVWEGKVTGFHQDVVRSTPVLNKCGILHRRVSFSTRSAALYLMSDVDLRCGPSLRSFFQACSSPDSRKVLLESSLNRTKSKAARSQLASQLLMIYGIWHDDKDFCNELF